MKGGVLTEMQSIQKRLNKIMNKRGNVALVGDQAFEIGFVVILIFVVLYIVATLNPTSFFTASSLNANSTLALQQNLSVGVGNFGANIPSIFNILGVVALLGIILLLVIYA